MIPELGHYALVLALALGLIQSVVPVIGARRYDAVLMRLANSTALMQFAFVALSFLALIICYVTSDFSVATVYENSHSMMPLVYRVTSVWGNHEGSMLLWVFDSVALRGFGCRLRRQFTDDAESVCVVGAIVDRLRLLFVHSHHLQSFPAAAASSI